MPEFQIRVNASRYDLPEYFDCWQKATELAQFYGVAHRLREQTIVCLIEHYVKYCIEKGIQPSEDFFLKCITAFGDRGITTISRLIGMLEGVEPLAFQAAKQMNEMPGRMRQREENQGKSVSRFLTELALDKNKPMPIEKPATKRLPDGWMKRDDMVAWMRDNHPHDLDAVDDFFNYLGVDPKLGPMYVLKIRVSQ